MKNPVNFTLKVTLSETRPAVWRRLIVPADIVLHRLDTVIRVAMGWSRSNPYFFTASCNFYANDLEPSGSLMDGRKTNLAALLRGPGDWIGSRDSGMWITPS